MELEFGVNQEVWVIEDGCFRKHKVREIRITETAIMFNVDNHWTNADDMGSSIGDLAAKKSAEAKKHYSQEG